MNRRLLDLLLPTGLYAAFELASRYVFELEMLVAWHFPQLLDPADLMDRPIRTLFLLHGQPPLLNVLLAVFVQIEKLSGIGVPALFDGTFLVLGCLASNVLYRVVHSSTSSRLLAALGLVGMLSDPALLWFRNVGFYTFLLVCFHAFLMGSALRYLRGRATTGPVGCALWLTLLALTRTLYHPLWALASLVFLMALHSLRSGSLLGAFCRRNACTLVAMAGVLLVWPAKNYWLFGQFTYTSWQGWYFTNAAGVDQHVIADFWQRGDFPKERVAAYELPAWLGEKDREHLTRAEKRWPWPDEEKPLPWKRMGFVANANHLVFLLDNRELTRSGIRWRLEHPLIWLATVRRSYMHYTQLPNLTPYGSRSGPSYDWHIAGQESPRFLAYTSGYARLVYFDVHPVLDRLLPGFWDLGELRGKTWFVARLSFYGAVVLPTILIYAAYRARRFLRARTWRSALAALCLSVLAWNLVLSISIDGWESMRYRLSTTPMCWAITCLMLAHLGWRLRSWSRRVRVRVARGRADGR